MELLKVMTGQGAMTIREIARRAGRNVKGVHGDIHALLDAGVLDREDNRIVFPYDGVHVDFKPQKEVASQKGGQLTRILRANSSGSPNIVSVAPCPKKPLR